MDDRNKTREQLIEELAELRSRLEDEKKDREASYNSLLEQLPSNAWVYKAALDDSASTIFVSPQIELLGFSQQEWISNRDMWSRQLHPDDRERVLAEFERRRRAREAFECEYRLLTSDGRVLWFRDHAVILRDSHGTPVCFQGLMVDITESKRAEKWAADAFALNRTILDRSPAGIIIYKATGQGVMANEAAASIVGGSPEELASLNFHDIRSWRESGLYEAACEALESGRVVRHDVEMTTTFGRHICLEAIFSTFSLRGERHLALLFNDISGRKKSENALRESEERYRSLFENSAIPIWEEDFSGVKAYFDDLRIAGVQDLRAYFEIHPDEVKKCADIVRVVEVNAESLRFAHAESKDELSKNLSDHFIDESWPVFREELIALAEGRGHFDGEMPVKDTLGSSRQILLKVSVPPKYNSTLDKVLVSFVDITYRKKAEEEKLRLEAQLRQAQKMETIGTLAGGIAHDFNNLLQPLGSCAELMRSQLPADSPLMNYVELISKAVTRGRGLVKQMLTFSRLREHERKPLRLDMLIKDVLSLIRAGLPAGVEIHEHIDQAGDVVLADLVHIQQVLMNLCTNACDAMEGRGVLEVSLVALELNKDDLKELPHLHPGRYLRMSVRDAGSGMESETLKRVFDPFFTTKEVGKGTGLGLSVVYGIVMEHQGEIAVESEPGKGAVFHVYLPCVENEAVIEPQKVATVIPHKEFSVLLVDDDEDIVLIAKDLLEYMGHCVTACCSASEVLEKFSQNEGSYDLVLTDYSMSRMTGIELSSQLRKVRANIPIVIMTGNDQAIPEDALNQVSINAIISKPFSSDEIAATIRRVMAVDKTECMSITAIDNTAHTP